MVVSITVRVLHEQHLRTTGMAQAAMSMLLGLRKEVLDTADALEPRNLHNGATWPYPPAMIMRILDDEAEVVERCNQTINVMRTRASLDPPPSALPTFCGIIWMRSVHREEKTQVGHVVCCNQCKRSCGS